ncbi:MAG: hypothetical protein O7G88_17020 [bacterium]|nr:hypothetical protein [bacterium]
MSKLLRTGKKAMLVFAFAVLGFWCTTAALAGHRSSSSTSGGTSSCKLCTILDFDIDVGDLDLKFVGIPVRSETVRYTSRPGQTFTGTVCNAANPEDCRNADGTFKDDPTIVDTAEFEIDPEVLCTGYVEDRCRKSRRDSELTFLQQCGSGADCTGRVVAATDGVNPVSMANFNIVEGQSVNLGGAIGLTSDCNTAFPRVKGKGGAKAGQMGTIVQLHIDSKTCNADLPNIVDVRHDQRTCSSIFGTTPGMASCSRGEPLVVVEAGFSLNQQIIGKAAAECNPGTMQPVCSATKDEGKHHIFVTGAQLALEGVSPNDVDLDSLLCGNQVPPVSVVISDTDGDGLDDINARCFTCNLETSEFLCGGLGTQGQCELTGTDGVQPFAAICAVTLTQ